MLKTTKQNRKWADINMTNLKLEKLILHFNQCNRADGKSEKTIAWYKGQLTGFLRFLEAEGLLNGKMRDELLDREIFTTLTEARVLIEQWRQEYNQVRPHSALGYRPPAPEAVLTGATTKTMVPLIGAGQVTV